MNAHNNLTTNLPVELIFAICNLLLDKKNYFNIINLSMVCKYFNNAINKNYINQKLVSTNPHSFTVSVLMKEFHHANRLVFQRLIKAISEVDEKTVQWYLIAYNQDPNIKGRPTHFKDATFPLHYAINCYFYYDKSRKKDFKKIIELLLQGGADIYRKIECPIEIPFSENERIKKIKFLNNTLGQDATVKLQMFTMIADVNALQYAQILGEKFGDKKIEKLILQFLDKIKVSHDKDKSKDTKSCNIM